MDAVTRLPEYVQRVIVLHRDETGHVIYTDPEINERPDAYIVTPLPDYIQRVVIQLRDGTYYEIYRNLI